MGLGRFFRDLFSTTTTSQPRAVRTHSERAGSSEGQQPANLADEGQPIAPATEEGSATPAERKRELYSSDEPISSSEADRFKRSVFAERVARTIAERRDPNSLVIGIYGPWGDGKTSTLNLTRSVLAQYDHIVCVSFNPWHFASDDLLLKGFFESLAHGLKAILSTRGERIGDLLEKYSALLSVASSNVGSAAKEAGERLSNVSLKDLHDRVDQLLRNSRNRVVVMIDDIDRLDRREIQMMLKLVKLSAGFSNTCYVLAFDDQWVAAALGEKYGDGGAAAGRNFLEKIVQVPLHLPRPHADALRQLTFDGVNEALRLAEIHLTRAQADTFVAHFASGIETQLSTPRQAKLYGNVLSFALPILKGEVNPVDQMLVEGIRAFYPTLYKAIRDNPERFLRFSEPGGGTREEFRAETQAIIARAVADVGTSEKGIKRLIETLFPQLSGTYGSEWDQIWAKEKRVSSRAYFARYFHYGVPHGDISDVELGGLLSEISSMTETQIDERLLHHAQNGALGKWITKLRRIEEEIDPTTSTKLALSIARTGQSIPRERGPFMDDHSRRQAAILVFRLLRNLSDNSARAAAARTVVETADPLPFGVHCWYWFERDPSTNEEFLPLPVVEELAALLVSRIEKSWVESPLYVTYGSDASGLLWFWNEHADHEHVEQLVRDRIALHPDELDELLDCQVGWSYDLSSGASHRGDFSRSHYDSLTKIVSADFLWQGLRARYGNELDLPIYHREATTSLALKLAHQFAYIHQQVAAEQIVQAQQDTEDGHSG